MASVLDEAPPPPLTMDSIEELRTHLWKVHQVTVENEALTDAVRERLSAMQEAARLADTAQDRFRKMVKLISILTALNLVAVVFTLGVLTVLTI